MAFDPPYPMCSKEMLHVAPAHRRDCSGSPAAPADLGGVWRFERTRAGRTRAGAPNGEPGLLRRVRRECASRECLEARQAPGDHRPEPISDGPTRGEDPREAPREGEGGAADF